jgi:hypothetical protein
MALLQSLNAVLRDLREAEASSISATGLLHQTIVGALNQAAAEILNTHSWTFLTRNDGVVWFPGRFSATEDMSIAANGSTGSLNSAGLNAWANANVSDFTQRGQNGRVAARWRTAGDATFGQTSIAVTDLSVLPAFPFTLRNPWRGATIVSGGFEMYAHEYALPDTVRVVTSTRSQEGDLQLSFIDRDFTMDAISPRRTESFAEYPTHVFVGGLVTGTSQDTSTVTAQSGLGFTIWPPCENEVAINYSYVYRFADLSSDTDTWTGVPSEVVKVIEKQAFALCLMNNVEDDPKKAQAQMVQNEFALSRLKAADGRMLHKRYVPREIGIPSRLRNPRSRWQTQVIPEP